MKAIMKFNLNDHDDSMAHLRATKSLDLSLALWDIQNLAFNDTIEDVEAYKEAIRDIFDDHNIIMSELID